MTTNHCGNLNLALKMIEAAKDSGATIIKMQKKNVDAFYSKEKLSSPFKSPYGNTYGEYRNMFEFSLDDFIRIDRKCHSLDIEWFSTVQDVDSLNFFIDNACNFTNYRKMIKIASCNASNRDLFERMKLLGDAEIVISTGGLTLNAIDEIVNILNRNKLYIQHCVSAYPCPNDRLYLGNIPILIDRYKDNKNVFIGYSGHEIGYAPTILAAYMGACIIERHFCITRNSFVHHIECSLTPSEFKEMSYLVKNIDTVCSHEFGLKDIEKKFLKTGSYGTDDIGTDYR
jgi:N-acetylneuraminate synthase